MAELNPVCGSCAFYRRAKCRHPFGLRGMVSKNWHFCVYWKQKKEDEQSVMRKAWAAVVALNIASAVVLSHKGDVIPTILVCISAWIASKLAKDRDPREE